LEKSKVCQKEGRKGLGEWIAAMLFAHIEMDTCVSLGLGSKSYNDNEDANTGNKKIPEQSSRIFRLIQITTILSMQ